MAEDFVTQLARIARAGYDDRGTLKAANATDRESKPVFIVHFKLVRRPTMVLEQVAAVRSLNRDVVHLIRRRTDPDVVAHLFGPVREARHRCSRRQADPAEVILGKTEDRAVVDHATVRIAHSRVDDLTDRELSDIARHAILEQSFSIRTQDLELAQRRQVDDRAFFAARPILADRPFVVEARGQPIAVVLCVVAGESREALGNLFLGSFGGSASGVLRIAIARVNLLSGA